MACEENCQKRLGKAGLTHHSAGDEKINTSKPELVCGVAADLQFHSIVSDGRNRAFFVARIRCKHLAKSKFCFYESGKGSSSSSRQHGETIQE